MTKLHLILHVKNSCDVAWPNSFDISWQKFMRYRMTKIRAILHDKNSCDIAWQENMRYRMTKSHAWPCTWLCHFSLFWSWLKTTESKGKIYTGKNFRLRDFCFKTRIRAFLIDPNKKMSTKIFDFVIFWKWAKPSLSLSPLHYHLYSLVPRLKKQYEMRVKNSFDEKKIGPKLQKKNCDFCSKNDVFEHK